MNEATQIELARIADEVAELRQQLDQLASAPREPQLDRYEMQRPERPKGLYWQLRWLVGGLLRRLAKAGILPSNPWPTGLAHTDRKKGAKPVLVWGLGASREQIRDGCDALSRFFENRNDIAPVLVTDVADFAYFSRLSWLIEYVPHIVGNGENFESRKLKLLAKVYPGAAILPLRSGLLDGVSPGDVLRWIGTPKKPGNTVPEAAARS